MDPTAPPGGGKDYYDDEVGISMVGLKSKKSAIYGSLQETQRLNSDQAI